MFFKVAPLPPQVHELCALYSKFCLIIMNYDWLKHNPFDVEYVIKASFRILSCATDNRYTDYLCADCY